ncbi:hypothetical protein F3Y22_tig00111027pilonHSYRG00646 [Hibiscus syriacus]|uniref:RNase H type-1 domain-containing protein n=1 Tax=Hibiscus syriacus TaxID=106335 RepID=A0A6A2Z6B6_HIBSY|nr:hypothetical protein F3Y22_tig00111027pilonHSYRG00646 [Hibiscus syriacus]
MLMMWFLRQLTLALSVAVGVVSALHAELWAILIGLQFARDKGFDFEQVHSDCAKAVEMLNDTNASLSSLSLSLSLVRFIDAFRHGEWATTIIWIPRNCNKPAYMLAKNVDPSSLEIIYLTSPPAVVVSLLEMDTLYLQL